MKAITTLPNLAESFQKLKLQDEIAKNNDQSLFASICREAIWKDLNGTLKMMKDQIEDSPMVMISMFGESIVSKIKSLSC